MSRWVNLSDALDAHTEEAAREIARHFGKERAPKASPKTYPCRCGIVFDKPQALAGHVSTKHPKTGVSTWPCRTCERWFHTEGGRNLHERIHGGDRQQTEP